MKTATILLLATLLVSGTILAKPPATGERDYVLQTINTTSITESPLCTTAAEDLGKTTIWSVS